MWPNRQFPADLVTVTEKIFSGKLHFLCSDCGNTFLIIFQAAGFLLQQEEFEDEIWITKGMLIYIFNEFSSIRFLETTQLLVNKKVIIPSLTLPRRKLSSNSLFYVSFLCSKNFLSL